MSHGRKQFWVFRTLVAAALISAAICTSASAAGTSFDSQGVHVDVSTDTAIVGEETRFVNATLTLVTGSKAFRSKLSSASPRYTRYLAGRPWLEGATMRSAGMTVSEGTFDTLGSGSGGGVGGACPTDYNTKAHGTEGEQEEWLIRIKAHQRLVLTFKFEIIGDAPWINTSYAPIMRFTPPTKQRRRYPGDSWDSYKVPKGSVTFRKLVTLQAPSAAVGQPLAARVDLNVAQKLKWSEYRQAYGMLPVRKAVPLRGQIVPPLAGQPIDISLASDYGEGPDQKLVQVVTDDAGNFAYDGWIPTHSGSYLIRAAYPGQPGSPLAPDTGCPLPLFAGRR